MKKNLKKILLGLLTIGLALYVAFCGYLYFNQESFIFHPSKLSSTFEFHYGNHAQEMFIEAEDGTKLNGLLFTVDSSKGLVFYLHGNAGTLETWGGVAKNFTKHNYDVFILDYRGFGKSEGIISNQQQFFNDAQAAYDELKKKYSEDKITILGYSIGTGIATYLASTNNPKRLILQAPFYNMSEMVNNIYPIVPPFLLKYKFKTSQYIQSVKAPIVLLHGDKDEVIPYDCSERLKKQAQSKTLLIKLNGLGHSGWGDTEEYQKALAEIL